jgi:hypothetical protein
MDAPSALIMEKLSKGSLPVADPLKLWDGYGIGRLCDGCDIAITRDEQEQEVEMPNGQTLFLHVACHDIWRTLKDTRPQE